MPRPTNSPISASVVLGENSIQTCWDDSKINHYIEGADGHKVVSSDFAAFLLLPVAMQEQRDLHIDGIGDPVAARNAETLSKIWSIWRPDLFSPVRVSFRTNRETPCGDGDILLFSGGLDATHNLLCSEGPRSRPTLLTVQGADYSFENPLKINQLLKRNKDFVSEFAKKQIVVRTDTKWTYKAHKVNLPMSHGFFLISCLFLFNGRYQLPRISADYTRAQDFLAFPWGTNHVTNPYFATSNFRLQTDFDEVARSEKCAVVANHDIALKSISFCKDSRIRPDNCGVCEKCLRTKAMFIATTGREPDIFLESGITREQILGWNVDKIIERAFFMDLYQSAVASEYEHLLPGLDETMNRILSLPSLYPDLSKAKSREQTRLGRDRPET